MKKFLSVFVALLLVIAIIPASSMATTQYGYVTGGWLRLRSSPSFSASTIASYNTGTRVEILGTSGSWYHVEMADGTTGYMYTSYISLTSPGTGTGTAYVTSTNGYGVRMRTGPGTSYSIIGVYSVGTAVTVLETGTNWCKIQIGSHVGYMMKKFLTTSGGGGGTGDSATIWSPNGYGVRLRTGAGTGYSIIGVYSVGTTVTIITHGTTWDYISVGSRTGYMMNYYLTNYSSAVATGITVTPASATAAQGATVALTAAVTGTSLSSPAYTLAVTQNATMASISGNNLVISGTATVGAVIQVTATTVNNNSSGNKITATCTVTVTAGTPVATGISISPATASVKQGNSVALTTTVTGSSLSSPSYTLSITQNASMASLSGNTLTVNGSATVGSVIKVTALSADNNSTGNKLAAIAEITVIASTAPGAPTLTGASAGNTQVTLTWTAPSDNGGVALSGYKVYYGTTNVIGAASSTSLLGGSLTGTTVTGLTNDTPYYFWVAAVNSVGEGSPSASSTATPSATVTVPGAPTLTSATAGDTQVTLVWTAPADIGSSALTGYKVYVNTVDTFATATGSSVFGGSLTGTTVTSLTNGTTYYFWVAAVNSAGEGTASSSLNTTPATEPDAPVLVSATPGNGQATLTWTAPADNGGSALTGFTVYTGTTSDITAATSQAVSGGSSTGATVSGLTNGTTYYFWVAAVNSVGEGVESNNISAMPVTVPAAPSLDSATPGSEQVSLAWTPGSTGGSAITSFKLYHGISSDISLATVDTISDASVTGTTISLLTNGTTYYFWISAVNSVGEGATSAYSTATPATVPATPTLNDPTAGNTEVVLTWTVGSTGGSALTGFTVYYSINADMSSSNSFPVADGTATGATVSGLTNTTTYYFTVLATNIMGNSMASNTKSATPVAP